MSRLIRGTLIALSIAAFALVSYGRWKNPERETLSDAARVGVPGQFVTLSLGRTHFDISGPDTGRTVVLVHGFSVPSYIWDSTATALASRGYRVIRYDLYGRGWSDRPDAAYDGAMYDTQLDELLDSLHITQPIDLMGLSFGGFVTAHYVAGHAARVRTLTLVDPVSSSSPVPGFLSLPIIGAYVWQVTQMPGKAESQASDFLHPEHFQNWADLYRPQMRFNGFGRSLLRSAMTMSHTNFDSLYTAVAKTGVPVLLVWGQQDQTVPIALSRVVRNNIPAVEFVAIDSAGHLPHIEQSVLVHNRMHQFLVAHPVRAPSIP